jgi:AraC family transcriptional activator of pobA
VTQRYIYEKINHIDSVPFKSFVASLEGSCPHLHNDYEFILLLKGQFGVRISGVEFKMSAGDILLINSGEIHSIFGCEEGNICLFVQFHPDVLLDVLSLQNKRFHFYLNSCNHANRIKTDYIYFVNMVANIGLMLMEKDLGYEFHLRSEFYQLLGGLFKYTIYDVYYSNNYNSIDEDNANLDKLTEYIEKNYINDLDTEDICKYLGMSRSTLYRFMKNKLGLSLNEFIRYFRIEQAKRMLKSTDYSISHIAVICGYTNIMSFYRAFKKETNKTPQDFKEKGDQVNTDKRIQGYVSYNDNEAQQLVRKYTRMTK